MKHTTHGRKVVEYFYGAIYSYSILLQKKNDGSSMSGSAEITIF